MRLQAVPWSAYGPPAGFLVGFFLLWEFASRVLGISRHLLPAPTAIVVEVFSRLPFYLHHAFVTLQAAAAGLAMAFILATVLSFMIAEIPWLGRAAYPLIIASQAVPAVAIAPVLVLIFGHGLLPKAIVATLICFFPLTLNISRGLMEADRDAMTLMRALGAGRLSIVLRYKVPNALPYIFAGVNIAVVLSLVGAIVGEWVGSLAGLGYLIMVASEQLSAPLTFGAIFVTCAMGLTFYGTVQLLERWLMPWK